MIFIRKFYLLLGVFYLSGSAGLAHQEQKKRYIVLKQPVKRVKQKEYELVVHLKYHHLIAAGCIGLCAGAGLIYGSYTLYSYYPQIIKAFHAYKTIMKYPWIITAAKKIQSVNSWSVDRLSPIKTIITQNIQHVNAWSKSALSKMICLTTDRISLLELDATRGLL